MEAVIALSHCTPHPDIFWTKGNVLPTGTREAVAASLRWHPFEIERLLRLIDTDENGIDRGSLGQCVYMILFEDPDCLEKLERSAAELVLQDAELAAWAAYLAVARSEDQREQWRRLLGHAPSLAETFVASFIEEALAQDGLVSLD